MSGSKKPLPTWSAPPPLINNALYEEVDSYCIHPCPGILQLSISYKFQRPNGDGSTTPVVRKVFGKVNLYHVLKQANLIEYSPNMQYATKSCDYAVLDIPGVMKLNPEGIASGKGDGGFSSWEQIDDPDHPVETDDGTQPELY